MTRTPASELEAGLNRTARRTVMSDNQQLPQPDPALRRLDRLVGTWTMEGNLVGSDEQCWRWRACCMRWI
jgi:hypothetical protein